jgi:biotin carboxyl carrier protein
MINEPFRITVNEHHTFEVQPEDVKALDVLQAGDENFHVLNNNRSFHAELQAADYNNRTFTFLINGNSYQVKVADHYERLVQQLGLSVGGSVKVNNIKAPMPGLVLSILVSPGQAVQKGDPLIILEAMKMENMIKSAGDGTVKSVKTTQGSAVDKGQVLIEME